jgi:hypothetical protein
VIPVGFHFSFQRFCEESAQCWGILYIHEASICDAPHQCLLAGHYTWEKLADGCAAKSGG